MATPHYVDQETYNSYLKKIKDLKMEIIELNTSRSDLYTSDPKGRNGSAIMSLEQREQSIKADIRNYQELVNNSVIIEKKEIDKNAVNIGDIVTLAFDGDDEDTETVVLVAGLASKISQTSINSPVGAAIYGAKVGETVNCDINGNNIMVKIVSKQSQLESEDGESSK